MKFKIGDKVMLKDRTREGVIIKAKPVGAIFPYEVRWYKETPYIATVYNEDELEFTKIIDWRRRIE